MLDWEARLGVEDAHHLPPTFLVPSQIILDTSRLVGGDTRGLGLRAPRRWRFTLLPGCSGIISNHFGEVPPPSSTPPPPPE